MRRLTALVLAAMLAAPSGAQAQALMAPHPFATPQSFALPRASLAPAAVNDDKAKDEEGPGRGLRWAGLTMVSLGGAFALGSFTFNDSKGCGFFNELACDRVGPVYRGLAGSLIGGGLTLMVIEEQRYRKRLPKGVSRDASANRDDEEREEEEEEEASRTGVRTHNKTRTNSVLLWTGVGLTAGGFLLILDNARREEACGTCSRNLLTSRHAGPTLLLTGIGLMAVARVRRSQAGRPWPSTVPSRETRLEVGPRAVRVRVLF